MVNAGSFTPGPSGTGRSANFKKRSWGVGSYAWLDSEASKVRAYWRAIEFGSDAAVGRFLGGAWGDAGGGRGARHGQDLTGFGEGSGQQFIPYSNDMEPSDSGAFYSAKRARKIMREQGTRNPLASGYITKAIEPHDAYAKAFAAFDAGGKETAAVREVVGALMSQANSGRPSYRVGYSDVPEFMSVNVVSSLNLGLLSQFFKGGEFSRRMTQIERILAKELQDAIAEELEASYLRPEVSSGHLLEATKDPRNRFPQ